MFVAQTYALIASVRRARVCAALTCHLDTDGTAQRVSPARMSNTFRHTNISLCRESAKPEIKFDQKIPRRNSDHGHGVKEIRILSPAEGDIVHLQLLSGFTVVVEAVFGCIDCGVKDNEDDDDALFEMTGKDADEKTLAHREGAGIFPSETEEGFRGCLNDRERSCGRAMTVAVQIAGAVLGSAEMDRCARRRSVVRESCPLP